MPAFDGQGSVWGNDPGAGWGLGPCGAGMAWGRGRGFGFRRFGRRPYFGRAWMTRREESETLEEEAKILEEDLKALKERIAELKGGK